MESPKLPNKLTDQELLEQVEKGEDTVLEDNHSTDIISFISSFKIVEGSHSVKTTDLFSLYREWSSEPMKRYQFSLELGKLFPIHKARIYINISPQTVLQERFLLHKKKSQSRKKVSSKVWGNHFKQFLSDYKISKGFLFLEADIIYWVYDKWCYNMKRKSQLTYINFNEFMKMNFETKRIGQTRILYFGVSENIKDYFSENFINEWRQKRKEEVKIKETRRKNIAKAAKKAWEKRREAAKEKDKKI